MLKKGRYIKEEPPKIGRHWSYAMAKRRKTEEEYFAEAILRGDKIHSYTRLEHFVARLIGI